MKTPYRSNPKAFEDYYMRQSGNGLPYYSGSAGQSGHGLGSIFKGLFRAAAPLLVAGAKKFGKHVVRSGLRVAGDIASGKKPKQAIKSRFREAGTELLGQISQHGKGRVNKKRKINKNKAVYAKRKRNLTKEDIFS